MLAHHLIFGYKKTVEDQKLDIKINKYIVINILLIKIKIKKAGIGFNIAVINIFNGDLEDFKTFDTSNSSDQSIKLGDYLNAILPGKFVVGGVYYDGSSNLRDEAVKSLIKFGTN